MSTSNFRGAENLTQKEQTLHHYAAMVKRDLESYRLYPASMSQEDWKRVFKHHLARLIL